MTLAFIWLLLGSISYATMAYMRWDIDIKTVEAKSFLLGYVLTLLFWPAAIGLNIYFWKTRK